VPLIRTRASSFRSALDEQYGRVFGMETPDLVSAGPLSVRTPRQASADQS
jgi:hypothetical protein